MSHGTARGLALPRGPLLMILATVCFMAMVALVKLARFEMSSLQIVFWRSLVAVPMALVLAVPVGLRTRSPGLLALRSALGFVTMVGYFTAAGGLPVADLTLITKLQPVIVAVMAPLLLGTGERASRRIAGVLALGLLGSGLIVGPELSGGSWYGAIAVVAAVTSAGAHTCVRRLGATVHPYAQVFWFQFGVLLLSGATLLVQEGLPLPDRALWPHLVGVGVFATLGQWLMTHAYRVDRAPRVAAAAYTAPLMALLVDLVIFGTTPGLTALSGGALIVLAGLLLLSQREPDSAEILAPERES